MIVAAYACAASHDALQTTSFLYQTSPEPCGRFCAIFQSSRRLGKSRHSHSHTGLMPINRDAIAATGEVLTGFIDDNRKGEQRDEVDAHVFFPREGFGGNIGAFNASVEAVF